MTDPRPLIALTLGDPAGIGPEVAVKALADAEVVSLARILAMGDSTGLAQAARLAGGVEVHPVDRPEEGLYRPGVVDLLATSATPGLVPGRTRAACGEAAYLAVVKAAALVQAGAAEAICTAPLAKSSLHAAGHHFPGHTELLGHLTGVPEPVMLLAGPRLKVALVTVHAAHREVPGLLSRERILRVARLTHDFLLHLGLDRPRIAVAGLNPHAGESGLFGREELEIIAPAVAEGRRLGLDLTGPEVPDAVFRRAAQGEFEAVVAMSHDQGLIPLKLLHFDTAVNVTLGLPLIRTSVDHGTAFDLAGQGLADPTSLKTALRLAAALARPAAKIRTWD